MRAVIQQETRTDRAVIRAGARGEIVRASGLKVAVAIDNVPENDLAAGRVYWFGPGEWLPERKEAQA